MVSLTPDPLLFLHHFLGLYSVPDDGTASTSDIDVRLVQSLDTVYYPVTGTTTQDIFDSVKANGPDSETEIAGRFTSGLAQSSPSYRYNFIDRGGSCELESVEIELGLVVTLPQHSDLQSLSTFQQGRWLEFAEGVSVHEQTHVDIYVEGARAFQGRVKGLHEKFGSCDDLKSSLTSAWEAEKGLTDQKQDAFHRSEAQLSLELRGPVQKQIDDNKLVLTDLQEAIASGSSEIESLKGQIDELDGAMRPFDDQLAAIRSEYPDLKLPPDVFEEYEGVLAEWRALNDQRNAVVEQLNALVASHNLAVEESNLLSDETNRLIDEIAWLP